MWKIEVKAEVQEKECSIEVKVLIKLTLLDHMEKKDFNKIIIKQNETQY